MIVYKRNNILSCFVLFGPYSLKFKLYFIIVYYNKCLYINLKLRPFNIWIDV